MVKKGHNLHIFIIIGKKTDKKETNYFHLKF